LSVSSKFSSNFDASDSSTVTFDATYRTVTAFSDKLEKINDFVQVTNFDHPIYSRADNKENLIVASGDQSGYPFSRDGVTCAANATTETVDGQEIVFGSIIEDGSNGYHRWNNITQSLDAFPGIKYRWSAIVKRISGTGLFFISPLVPGANGSIFLDVDKKTVTGSSSSDMPVFLDDLGNGWFRFGGELTALDFGVLWAYAGLAQADQTTSYAGDSSSGFYSVITIQEAAADKDYVPTPPGGVYDHSEIRGVNGRSVLCFGPDQSRHLTSTSVVSDLLAVGKKHLWLASQNYATKSPQYLLSTDDDKIALTTGGGYCADFESGNSEYLSLANASIADLAPGDVDFSVSFWVKFESLAAANQVACSVFSATSGNYCWAVQYDNVSEKMAFLVSSDGANVTTFTDSVNSILVDTWYHIAAVHDATANTIHLSVNTVSGGTAAAHGSGAYASSTADFTVGTNGASEYLNGKISRLQFFSGVALDGAQISSLYNSGKGREWKELSGALATNYSWDLNEHVPTTNAANGERKAKLNAYDLAHNNTVLSSADCPDSANVGAQYRFSSDENTARAQSLGAPSLDIIHVQHESGSLKVSVNGGAGTVISCADTSDVTGTLILGCRSEANEDWPSYMKFCQMVTAKEDLSGYEVNQVTDWLSQRWRGTLPKTQKDFFVKLTTINKEVPGTTKVFWFGSTPAKVDEFYVGNVQILPILRGISGLGQSFGSGQVLPANRTGSISINNTRGTITHDTRLSDYLETYTFLGAAIEVYSFEKHPSHIGDFDDLALEFSGEVVNTGVSPQSSSVSLSIQGGLKAPETLQTRILKDTFATAPDRSIGQYLPLVFGQTELVSYVTEAITSPVFSFSTAFDGTIENSSIDDILVKDVDGDYRVIENGDDAAASISNTYSLDATGFTWLDSGAVGDNKLEHFNLIPGLSSSTNYLLTHVALAFHSLNVGSAAGQTVDIGIYGEDPQKTKPFQDPIARAQINSDDYSTEVESAAGTEYWIKFSLNTPVILGKYARYYIGISMDRAGSPDFYYRFASTDRSHGFWYRNQEGLIEYGGIRNGTLAEGNGGHRPQVRVYGAEYNGDLASVGDYSNVTFSQIAADSGQENYDLNQLSVIARITGLKDDGLGTITGTSSKAIESPQDIVKLIWYKSNADSLSLLDTSRAAGELPALTGATDGAMTARDFLALICQSSGMALFPLRSGKTALWAYGETQASVEIITEDDCKLLSIDSTAISEIVNSASISFDRTAIPLPIEDVNSNRSASFLNTLESSNASSVVLYGNRPVSSSAENRTMIASEEAAAYFLQILFERFSKEKIRVKIQVPFWMRNFRSIELMDILELSHIDLPLEGGTESANTSKLPTVNRLSASFASADSSYLKLANADIDELAPGDNDFSVSLWVYVPAIGSNENIASVWKNAASSYCWTIQYSTSGGGKFNFWMSSDGEGGTASALGSSNSSATAGGWQHIVCTYDASAEVRKIYIDGALDASGSYAGGAFASTPSAFVIGGNDTPANYLNGKVSMVQYFFGKDLTTSEIAYLNNEGLGRSHLELGKINTDGEALYTPYAWDLGQESDGSALVTRIAAESAYNLTDNNTTESAEETPGGRQVLYKFHKNQTWRRAGSQRFRVKGRTPIIRVGEEEESLISFDLESIAKNEVS